MKSKSIYIALSTLFLKISLFAQAPGQVKILFDNTHAETSGTTADWCIDADQDNMGWGPSGGYVGGSTHANPQRIPTPAQSGITSSTPETYWTGALSYWAIDCVNKGYWVETLPFGGAITYGTTNTQDLSNYNVFVVDEPNIRFTQTEIAAIMHFIQNGGSLLAISDHNGSDRNNDGWDSPAIWNDFMTNNPIANNAFGYTFSLQSFSGLSNNMLTTGDSITRGPFGNVAEVQWSSGTCMTINPSQNPSVKAHIWKSGRGQTDTAALCVTARWNCGKIASISDSSPTDDGTGNPNSTLYTGYTGDAAGNHRPWLMNIMIWLAEGSICSTGIYSVKEIENTVIYPNPFMDQITIKLNNESEKVNVKVNDGLGRMIKEKQGVGKIVMNTEELGQGIYFVEVTGQISGTFIQKLVK